ncbi:hypothetical protein PQR66_19440 [Paraburkholderia agricolaris]|uniref:Uncharacterized protein n=1 Tax=Paraburkholderia agricolaris TaxID=2152888 RepID=A0ABW8ZST2_9BURK
MPTSGPRSASIVALLIIINLGEYAAEKGRPILSYRFNRATLRTLALVPNLRHDFLERLSVELQNRGWHLLDLDDHFAVIHVSRVNDWARLTSKRVRDYVEHTREELEERVSELFPAEASVSDE